MKTKKPSPQHALLIGDSIRQSYQRRVAKLLSTEIKIVGYPQDINCRDTRTTLKLLETLELANTPMVIHWNNGLHDIKRRHDQCAIPQKEYRKNLEKILVALRQICPGTIIWRMITPVIESRHNRHRTYARYNVDVDAYNHIACDLMKKEGVRVHDLHTVIQKDITQSICEDGVHLTTQGANVAAQSVADSIHRAIHAPSNHPNA